ncbi:hypothetical protein EMPS_04592 [Entomortierella parvispora]|uniref:Pyridoxamine 5'-phosphate oxidase N-terminal domain-containing protein n=1 Tax=Entomortierella parvispora TaxID=205924 RepID=A0A9P3LVY9_9FUNG|nr:hypothetical protein EMPS_04592 [Entomortierella parvispora]
MGKTYDSINDSLAAWIRKQHLFFCATAPMSAEGTVNTSPKGYDSFRILNPNRVCYLDLTGSGNETLSHLQENGRITFLFMEFEKAPRILRLFGQGHFVRVDTPEFEELYRDRFEPKPDDDEGASGKDFGLDRASQIRGIIVADIHKVATSCGWGIPYYEFKGERPTLKNFWGKRTREELGQFWRMANTESLDGLPGFRHELMGPEFAPTEETESKARRAKTKSGWLSSGPLQTMSLVLGSSALVAAGFSAGIAASVFL